MIANKYQIIGQRLGLIIENTLGRKSVFSEKIGRDQSQLSRILKGESRLTQDILESLAEYFNVNINWLLTGEGEMFISEIDPEIKENLGNYAWIPRYDLVVRGGPGNFQPEYEEILERIPLNNYYLSEVLKMDPNNLIAVNVEGDSMYPLINEGDLAIVNLTHKRLGQDGIYVLNHNGYLRIKQLQLLLNEKKVLVSSDNPRYQDEFIDEFSEHEMIIIGKLVLSIKRF